MNEGNEFLTKIVKAMPIASPDVTRNHLGGVLLDPREAVINIVATDGHRLIVNRCAGINKPSQRLLVRKHHVAVIKEALKFYKKLPIDVKFNGLRLIMGQFEVALETSEFYPKYEKLIPTYTCNHEIGLNAKYLLELAKTAIDNKHNTVKISFKDELSPMRISTPNSECTDLVLMPCRV